MYGFPDSDARTTNNVGYGGWVATSIVAKNSYHLILKKKYRQMHSRII